ncbi:hypothetical protein MKW98_012551 [Papaver atlanticum]|uniref:FAS1 domain-containing protein n=1 Tax=Papaver atlanticum TaxID=357466 RepID=A0AAD4SZQ2_9MAGN|nr:hypothetical protein MKW98_012551 [Papaver atlanticum]
MKSQFFLGYLSLFLLSSSFTTAFDITKLLNSHSEFSTYNSFLTSSQVAATINERQTITVLVVDNSGISSLSGKSNEVIKKVMSLHVVLDYYEAPKLQKLPNKTALLTTLFQTTGLANGQQGYLNVTASSGDVKFGSAVQGSSLSSSLVKSVASQPYNISVLQISSLIMPPGIENSNTPPAPKAAAPAPSKSKTPPSADSSSKSPSKSPPPESSDDKAPTSSKKASPPKASDSPPSPTPAAADAPAAAHAPAAADAPGGASAKKSSGSRVITSGVVVAVFVVVVSCFWVAL